jgi:hypothetical protein
LATLIGSPTVLRSRSSESAGSDAWERATDMSSSRKPEDRFGLHPIAAEISNKLITLGEDEESAIKFSFDVVDKVVNATRKAIRNRKMSASDDPLAAPGQNG